MADMRAYAEWLRRHRERVEPELSQAGLARLVGVSRTYINLLEKGQAEEGQAGIDNPSPDKVDAISRALEKFLRRPLVNEARGVLGYPLLAGELVEGGSNALLLTEEELEYVNRLRRLPPAKRKQAMQFVQFVESVKRASVAA